jgi:hypothetical protein
VTDRKNGGILFDRPKPTAGCSANGRRINCFSIRVAIYFTILNSDIIQMNGCLPAIKIRYIEDREVRSFDRPHSSDICSLSIMFRRNACGGSHVKRLASAIFSRLDTSC